MEDQNKEYVRGLIAERTVRIPWSGCWIWEGSSVSGGYGDFRAFGKKHFLAHRAAYEAFCGEISAGMHVCHSCDVRACCNPSHLFIGTNVDNIADSMAKGRRKGITRRRPSGLEYTPQSIETRERRAKLKRVDYALVKGMRDAGMLQRQIAAKFGVSQPTVTRVLKRFG